MRGFSSDIRYALRAVKHGGISTAVAVLSLAVGVGGNAEIIIGRGLWKRRFGSDAGLLGKVVDVNIINLSRVGATPSFVVGIATADVHFPPLSADYNLGVGGIDDCIDFWMPEVRDPTRRDN